MAVVSLCISIFLEFQIALAAKTGHAERPQAKSVSRKQVQLRDWLELLLSNSF
jgi:hypothetical protein